MWGEWDQWSDCSASCGGGVSSRNKLCNYPDPKYPGNECDRDYPFFEEDACNETACSGKLSFPI